VAIFSGHLIELEICCSGGDIVTLLVGRSGRASISFRIGFKRHIAVILRIGEAIIV